MRPSSFLLLLTCMGITERSAVGSYITVTAAAGISAFASYHPTFGLVLDVENTSEEIGYVTGDPIGPGYSSAWVEARSGPASEAAFDTSVFSQVDAPTGIIRANAAGARPAVAAGILSDELTFTNTTDSTALIAVDFFANGFVFGGGTYPLAPSIEAAFLFADSASFVYRLFGVEESNAGGTWESFAIGPPSGGNAGASFRGVHSIPPGVTTLSLRARLSLGCGVGSNCDFSHTAGVGLRLPPGVTFTSASGVLLTEDASAVPEPSPSLLAFTGLSLWALFARTRKQSRSQI